MTGVNGLHHITAMVVGRPKHPYTQLLIGSIPLPDPNHQWPGRKPQPRSIRTPGSRPRLPLCRPLSRGDADVP